jgi:hypothetical protein
MAVINAFTTGCAALIGPTDKVTFGALTYGSSNVRVLVVCATKDNLETSNLTEKFVINLFCDFLLEVG